MIRMKTKSTSQLLELVPCFSWSLCGAVFRPAAAPFSASWTSAEISLVLSGRAPSDPSAAATRPAVTAGSEVYKMLQENQESDEPPRQSASFKVLQEILETGEAVFWCWS